MANGFLRGFLGGLQPVGSNIAEALRMRRETTEKQMETRQKRMREMVGLGLQSEDPDTIESMASGITDPAFKGLLTGKSKVLRQKQTDTYTSREKSELDRIAKEYLENEGAFAPATDPNTAFLATEMIERTLKPRLEQMQAEKQRKQRLEGIKVVGDRAWDFGGQTPTALTPEKAEKPEKPEKERVFTVPGEMPRYESGQPVFPGIENAPQLRDQFEKVRSGLKAVPFLEKSGELERTYDAFKASISSLKANSYRKSPGQEIAIANFFQRFIDPATVREGDIALQRSATSIFQQLETYLRRTAEGGLIPAGLINSLEQTVDSAMKSHRSKAKDFANAYLSPLEKVGYDKKVVDAVRESLGSLIRESSSKTSGSEAGSKQARFEDLRRRAEASGWDLPDDEAREYESLRQEFGH